MKTKRVLKRRNISAQDLSNDLEAIKHWAEEAADEAVALADDRVGGEDDAVLSALLRLAVMIRTAERNLSLASCDDAIIEIAKLLNALTCIEENLEEVIEQGSSGRQGPQPIEVAS